MTFATLALCLSIIAFALVCAAGSALTTILHRSFAGHLEHLSAAQRSSAYLALRLAPVLGGLLFVGLFFLPAFLLFEPRGVGETVNLTLTCLTAVAGLPLLRGVVTGLSGWRMTRRRVARWLVDAEALQPARLSPHPAWVVQSPFPMVAVVGIRRPFLVVSQAVIDACSDDELAAILAHEATHVNRRDNLKRLLMLGAPDLLSGTATARSMELDWQRASEEVADDGAGASNSLHLAAALVKVARLAQGLAAPPATLAAFCRGGDITRRVSRLADARPASGATRPRAMLFASAALAAIVTLALAAGTWQHIHALTEVAVNLLQ